ncbi:M20/M25/M40 family metallo-hydrolase [Nakamurella endophytica]|uniref:Succinyl-diaminopimelate desuccinylase n=1 Tax=Nakamurella endophytica TaxID=1748367 RepID=A0A917SUC0_9ACTN|nr:M20/M25/M40 family metallo-hydrolase [Nakamurella endophytica]GGL98076.1 succinyl-diaminopimelate desuccinylase [Nakamurella endophytica]
MRRLQGAGRTPALVCDIPGTAAGPATLVYGHLDVQPAGEGWSVTSPFDPERHGDRLFGRGSGDDKYVPAMVTAAVRALAADGLGHPRVVVLLETSEESSSVDLPAYLDAERERIGDVGAVVCLDAFVPANDRLWITSSLRGIVVADLSVTVARTGVHSGLGGGVRPSTFRLLRQLLDRLEVAGTGEVLVEELHADPSADVLADLRAQASAAPPPADGLGLLPGVRPMATEPADQLLAQTWRPSVAYAGVDGMPPVDQAGSVLRAATTVRLSIRLPPTVDARTAAAALRRTLESDPPSGARVQLSVVGAENGFVAPRPADWEPRLQAASASGWGTTAAWAAGGATIPFLAMIAARYPDVPVLAVGLLDAASHPHGPDESLDLVAAARLTLALAQLLRG